MCCIYDCLLFVGLKEIILRNYLCDLCMIELKFGMGLSQKSLNVKLWELLRIFRFASIPECVTILFRFFIDFPEF